jgi:hypothetical protein
VSANKISIKDELDDRPFDLIVPTRRVPFDQLMSTARLPSSPFPLIEKHSHLSQCHQRQRRYHHHRIIITIRITVAFINGFSCVNAYSIAPDPIV